MKIKKVGLAALAALMLALTVIPTAAFAGKVLTVFSTTVGGNTATTIDGDVNTAVGAGSGGYIEYAGVSGGETINLVLYPYAANGAVTVYFNRVGTGTVGNTVISLPTVTKVTKTITLPANINTFTVAMTTGNTYVYEVYEGDAPNMTTIPAGLLRGVVGYGTTNKDNDSSAWSADAMTDGMDSTSIALDTSPNPVAVWKNVNFPTVSGFRVKAARNVTVWLKSNGVWQSIATNEITGNAVPFEATNVTRVALQNNGTASNAISEFEIYGAGVVPMPTGWNGALDGFKFTQSPLMTDNNPFTYFNLVGPSASTHRIELPTAMRLESIRLKHEQLNGVGLRVDWINSAGTTISYNYFNPGDQTYTLPTPAGDVKYIALQQQTGGGQYNVYELEVFGTGWTPPVNYSGGLLDGKPFTFGTSATANGGGTSVNMTDNNTDTQDQIAYAGTNWHFAYHQFSENKDITGYRINSTHTTATDTARKPRILFYNEAGAILGQIEPAAVVNSGALQTVNYKGVRKVALQGMDAGSGPYVREFNVYGTTTDPTPPAAPTGVAVEPGNMSLSISWNANTESDLAGYNVYVNGTKRNNGSLITARSYTVAAGLTNGTAYTVEVTAVDQSGNESPRSAPVTGTPEDRDEPTAPTGLTVEPKDGGAVLSWTASPESDVAGYNVYAETTGGGSMLRTFAAFFSGSNKLNTTPIVGTTFTAAGLTNGTTYEFTVTAVDNAGNESARSAPATATPVDSTAPATPTGLTATTDDGRVRISWTANAEPDLAGYVVYMNGARQDNQSKETSRNFDRLTNGTEYTFEVAAIDAAGNESPRSAPIKATPASRTAEPDAGETPEGYRISWAPIAGATKYVVYYNGKPVGETTTETSYTVTKEQGFDPAAPIKDYKIETHFADGSKTVSGSKLSGGWGFGAADILTNSGGLMASVAGFVLLGLVMLFAPKLIRFIWWIFKTIPHAVAIQKQYGNLRWTWDEFVSTIYHYEEKYEKKKEREKAIKQREKEYKAATLKMTGGKTGRRRRSGRRTKDSNDFFKPKKTRRRRKPTTKRGF